MFSDVYRGKTVFVTGHTGFKGSWLTMWLLKLGAKVVGYSNGFPSVPALFNVLDLEDKICHVIGDVRDLTQLIDCINECKPDFLFHMAAQPIVSESYRDPVYTMETNVLGTVNVLEALRRSDLVTNAVFITSDKCYENVEWTWGYRENDRVGGKDIYSGSKGAAEVVFHSYYESFFKDNTSGIRLATARAGNVIGGGDWAKDRIVVDVVNNIATSKKIELRSPNSTRPWQHVLEPLSGYLHLGQSLYKDPKFSGESYNFGPRSEQAHSVLDLVRDIVNIWGCGDIGEIKKLGSSQFHEAGLLKLNCDKALHELGWEANLNYNECVEYVAKWYINYYANGRGNQELTYNQISEYEAIAKKRKLIWTH